jgi:uridylate kinase
MRTARRVLLKLSGEALAGEKGTGLDEATCMAVAEQVKALVEEGIEIGIVTGAGNFWRGRTSKAIDRVKADQIGMLATAMNGIYVSEIFRIIGMKTSVLTPFAFGPYTEMFSKECAERYFAEGCVVFFAGGTGHPYFSTDMAAALRAVEMEVDMILAAKSIDGVYDSDPALNPAAKKYDTLPMEDVVQKGLGVMDLAAAVLCRENRMPMRVFGLGEADGIIRAARGDAIGTMVTV